MNKNVRINLAVSEQEKELWMKIAEMLGYASLSPFIRFAVNQYCKEKESNGSL